MQTEPNENVYVLIKSEDNIWVNNLGKEDNLWSL